MGEKSVESMTDKELIDELIDAALTDGTHAPTLLREIVLRWKREELDTKRKKMKKKETKNTEVKGKTAKEFKERKFSKVGSTVLEDLKKATDAEKEYRKNTQEGRE